MESFAQPNIVLVDDEQAVITSITALLRLETDFRVHGFRVPAEALAFLERTPAEVVISDYVMPEMDGLKLLAAARDLQPEASRILLTGHGDKSCAVEAINGVGLFQYLEKPWENGQLLLVVRAAVERARLLRELREKVSQLDAAHTSLKDIQSRLVKAFL